MRCHAGFILVSLLGISSCKSRGFNEQAHKALSEQVAASEVREGRQDGALHKSRFQEVLHKERKKFFTLLDDLAKRLVTSQEPLQFKYGQSIRDQLKAAHNGSSEADGGAGAHGSAKPNLADHAFHALWGRLAEAAPSRGMPHAGHHMKHFLQNSGRDLVLSEDAVEDLMKAFWINARGAQNPIHVEKDVQAAIESAQSSGVVLKKNDFLDNYASMLAQLEFVNNLELKLLLSKKVHMPTNGEPLTLMHYGPLKEYLTSLISKDSNSVLLDRPIVRTQRSLSSPDATDWFYALGSFSIITRTALLVQSVFDKWGRNPNSEGVSIEYSSVFSIFDRYNWDTNKGVYFFHTWCEKFKDIPCENLQNVTKLEFSDRFLGRLHTVGIAKEYDIWGYSKPIQRSEMVIFSEVFTPENIKKMQLLRDFYLNRLGLKHE